MSDGSREADRVRGELSEVFRKIAEHNEALSALTSRVAAARKRYKAGPSEAARQQLQGLDSDLRRELAAFGKLADRAQSLAGIPEDVIEALEDQAIRGDENPRFDRVSVSGVETTDRVETHFPKALEQILRETNAGWLAEQRQRHSWRLGRDFLESPLSLVRGARPESEHPVIHRFAQALLVSQDFLEGHPGYDFFAGALLVPQTTALGVRLPSLSAASGDVRGRVESLWVRDSATVESTVFELLVGGACLERGRNVEFLPASSEKTPDFRVHDYAFPTVIECKRKRPLSDYELAEEAALRSLFHALRDRVARAGMWGTYDLELTIESVRTPIGEVVDCCIRQRLSPNPAKPTRYGWGSVAYQELPTRLDVPTGRLYSPRFLAGVFGWDTDLPDHDGIICQVKAPDQIMVNQVREPVALLWKNISPEAIKQRSWTPVSLFGDATQQIPAGEVGVIYVCYREGARAEMADRRSGRLIAQLHEWAHDAMVRIPIGFAVRLYARPLHGGDPDLIESTMRFYSARYGTEAMFADFPSAVFTYMPGSGRFPE